MSDKPLPIAAAVYPINPPFDASAETATYSRSEAHDRLLALGYTGSVAERFLSEATHTLETMEPTSSAAKVLRAYLRDPLAGLPAEERQRICALALEARDRVYDRDPGTGGPAADAAYRSTISREVAAWRASQLATLPDDERRRIEVAAEQARAATGMRTSAPWAGQHVYEKTLADGAAAFHASQTQGQAAPEPAPEPFAGTWVVAQPGPSTVYLNVPYVATLPDSARVNLPAGTTLREGVDARPNTVDAIGLLRKARALIGSATGLNVDHAFRALSEIEAFLRREDAGEVVNAMSGDIDAEVERHAKEAKERHSAISDRLGPMSQFVWPYVVRPMADEIARLEAARVSLAERHQEAERQLHQGIAKAKARIERLTAELAARAPAPAEVDAEDLWTDYRTEREHVQASDCAAFLAGVEAGRGTASLTEAEIARMRGAVQALAASVYCGSDKCVDDVLRAFVAFDVVLPGRPIWPGAERGRHDRGRHDITPEKMARIARPGLTEEQARITALRRALVLVYTRSDNATATIADDAIKADIEAQRASRGETGPAPAATSRQMKIAEAPGLTPSESRAIADHCAPRTTLEEPRRADPPAPTTGGALLYPNYNLLDYEARFADPSNPMRTLPSGRVVDLTKMTAADIVETYNAGPGVGVARVVGDGAVTFDLPRGEAGGVLSYEPPFVKQAQPGDVQHPGGMLFGCMADADTWAPGKVSGRCPHCDSGHMEQRVVRALSGSDPAPVMICIGGCGRSEAVTAR